MKSGIYVIENQVSGKRYVGSSKDMTARWYKHRYDLRKARHTNTHLQRAWDCDGEGVFLFIRLEYCDEPDLIEREDWWVALLRCLDPQYGYNFLSARRHVTSAETRAKFSQKSREWWANAPAAERERVLSNLRVSKKGIKLPRSAEHQAKLTAAQTGRKKSPEQIEKMRASLLGNQNAKGHDGRWGKHSEEAKEKMRQATLGNQRGKGKHAGLGRALSDEHRKHIGEGLLGHRHTEEARAKMSRAMQGNQNGRLQSAETRQRQRERMMGNQYARKKPESGA